MSDVIVEK
jgi:hypothetical protein